MAKRAILAVLATALWSTAAFAHHPFAAEFDMTKPITLTGTVTKIEWQSPHVFAYVDAKDDQGKMANWKIELGSPAELTKAGWTRTSIKIGDSATFDGWRARNGSHLANAESVSIGDQKLVASSSFHTSPTDQLARADTADPQATGTSGTQSSGTSGRQELPATASPLALYLLLGGLSLAGGLGLRARR